MRFTNGIQVLGFLCVLLSAFSDQTARADSAFPPLNPDASVIEISDGPTYDFGFRRVGTSAVHTFTVTNVGASSVALNGLPLPQPFSYLGGIFPGSGGTCTASLPPAQSCTVVVQFLPNFPGIFAAALELKYVVEANSMGGSTSMKPLPAVARRLMKGASVPYGAALVISDSPEYDYGEIPYGASATHVFTLTNKGYTPLFGFQTTFFSTNGNAFHFTGGSYPGTGGTCGEVLNAGSSCTVVISFSPTAEGPYSSTLEVFYKSAGGGVYVATLALAGRGINGPLELAEETASACVLFSNGGMKCWGDNATGQLGLGDTVDRGSAANEMGSNLPFIDVGTGRTVKKLASAGSNTCAILDNNGLKCWGDNTFGQLALGDTNPRGVAPGQMGDNLPFIDLGTGLYPIKVVIGDASVCALLNNSKIKCWGNNGNGQLGLGDTNNRGDQPGEMGDNLPFVNLGNDIDGQPYEAVDIVAMFNAYCALLKSGNVKCWGGNTFGQLGLNDTINRGGQPNQMGDNLPFLNFGNGLTVKQLTAGYQHACALLSNNQVRCWGLNGNGQLGIGSTFNQADSPYVPFPQYPSLISARI